MTTTCDLNEYERICFWLDNFRVDDWTITASTEAAGFPKEAIKNPSLQTTWRTTTGADGQWIEGQGNEYNNKQLDEGLAGLAIIGHNLTSNQYFQFQMWQFSTSVYNNTNIVYRADWQQQLYNIALLDQIRPYQMRVFYIPQGTFTAAGITRWRLTLRGLSPPYYEIARIMLVRVFQPYFGAKMTELGTRDDSRNQKSKGGQIYTDSQAKQRSVAITMNPDTEMNDIMEWMRMIHVNGKRIPIIVDPYPLIPDDPYPASESGKCYLNLNNQMYGILKSTLSIQAKTHNLLMLPGRMVVDEVQ